MGLTKLKNLVNPEVMADMISAQLPKKIKFATIAKVDNTLVGKPGDTITVPKYAYIGDAEDVAEGVAMGTTVLTASTTSVTVKKAGKAVEITDEAALSGYGDPAGQATNQLLMSIAAKVDNDCYDALCGAKLVYDGTAAAIGYDAIVKADAKFGDESDEALNKVLYIHPNQEETLRLDSNFIDRNKFGGEVMATGVIGKIAGAFVRKSKKVKLIKYVYDTSGTIIVGNEETEEGATAIKLSNAIAHTLHGEIITVDGTQKITQVKIGDKLKAVSAEYYACPLVILADEDPNKDPAADGHSEEEKAVTVYLKRDVLVESDRDILAKTTVVSADEHYGVALSNESKVVLAKFKA